MALDAAQLTALFSEITTDPATLGYHVTGSPSVPDPAFDEANANLLNAISTSIQVDRLSIPMPEVVQCISHTEYSALTAANKSKVDFYTRLESLGNKVQMPDGSLKDSEAKNALVVAFGSATATRANLTALLQQPASRAEFLLGVGIQLTPSDVAKARNDNQ